MSDKQIGKLFSEVDKLDKRIGNIEERLDGESAEYRVFSFTLEDDPSYTASAYSRKEIKPTRYGYTDKYTFRRLEKGLAIIVSDPEHKRKAEDGTIQSVNPRYASVSRPDYELVAYERVFDYANIEERGSSNIPPRPFIRESSACSGCSQDSIRTREEQKATEKIMENNIRLFKENWRLKDLVEKIRSKTMGKFKPEEGLRLIEIHNDIDSALHSLRSATGIPNSEDFALAKKYADTAMNAYMSGMENRIKIESAKAALKEADHAPIALVPSLIKKALEALE